MNIKDARSLSEDVLQYMRRQSHRLRHEDKMSWPDIARVVGVSLSALMSWVRNYNLKNPELGDVSSKQRGRKIGEKRTLSPVQEAILKDLVANSTPQSLNVPYALWSLRAIAQAIKLKFQIDMPIRTVDEYMLRWNFTPQRPAIKAQEQKPIELERWLKRTYPAIEVRAAKEKATILWADETAVRQDTAWIRGFAAQGHTPEMQHTVRWSSMTMISAVSNKGLMHFALYDQAINSELFIEFLDSLLAEYAGEKIIVIVDNLKVHHSKEVDVWLKDESRSQRIELIHLPAYSPEQNPDEWLNRDLKTHLRMLPSAKNSIKLKETAEIFMITMKSLPERIKRYFDHRYTKYASAS